MNKLTINPNNSKWYSKDFIKGFECGVERQFEKDKAELTNIVEQTDGDLISRDYTIQQIQKAKESNYNFNYNTLIDFIKVLPSAEKATLSAEKTTITDTDLISRESVITMLNKIENAVEDGDGFQFNEWIEYAKDIPSAEKTEEKGENQMKWFRLVYQGEYIIAAENEKEAEELFNSECTELNESEGIEIRYIEELKGEEE